MTELSKPFLEKVYRNLQGIAAEEKSEIIEEIQNHIAEAVRDGASEQAVIDNLGDPAALAKSYVGETILRHRSFNPAYLAKMIRFYSFTGLSGMFVIPFTAVLSIGLYFSAIIACLAGLIQAIANLFGYTVPFTTFDFGFWQAPTIIAIPLTFVFAVLFYLSGKKLWQTLNNYLAAVSKQHQQLMREYKKTDHAL